MEHPRVTESILCEPAWAQVPVSLYLKEARNKESYVWHYCYSCNVFALKPGPSLCSSQAPCGCRGPASFVSPADWRCWPRTPPSSGHGCNAIPSPLAAQVEWFRSPLSSIPILLRHLVLPK
jgi:hypothetical protein